MGKKPVLGMVSAFCVGLALTGCKGANSGSDGTPVAKDNSSLYKTQPAFGQGATANTAPSNGWSTPPAAKSATGVSAAPMSDAAPMSPSMTGTNMRPMPAGGFGSTNVQPAGGVMPLGPPPSAPQDMAPRLGQGTDAPPASGSTSSNFPPPADMHTSSRMLPPPPALPAPTSLPPLPEAPAPTPPGAITDVPTSPAPPLPASMRSLPGDPTPAAAPTPDVGPVPLPPPPAPSETPPLPPLPPPPG